MFLSSFTRWWCIRACSHCKTSLSKSVVYMRCGGIEIIKKFIVILILERLCSGLPPLRSIISNIVDRRFVMPPLRSIISDIVDRRIVKPSLIKAFLGLWFPIGLGLLPSHGSYLLSSLHFPILGIFPDEGMVRPLPYMGASSRSHSIAENVELSLMKECSCLQPFPGLGPWSSCGALSRVQYISRCADFSQMNVDLRLGPLLKHHIGSSALQDVWICILWWYGVGFGTILGSDVGSSMWASSLYLLIARYEKQKNFV